MKNQVNFVKDKNNFYLFVNEKDVKKVENLDYLFNELNYFLKNGYKLNLIEYLNLEELSKELPLIVNGGHYEK